MLATRGVYIELQAEDPEQLAAFYERLFGLVRSDLFDGGIALEGDGLVVRIKPGLGDPTEGSVVFGFELGADTDLAASRDEAVAAGAVVLSESKRGEARLLACQDPAGNEFVLLARASTLAVSSSEALVPASRPASTEQSPKPSVPAVPPSARPTRRDVDRLRDVERLASMQEAIAGLDLPFSTDDPATVLSEMREKLGTLSSRDAEVAAADRELAIKRREAEVDDMLSRYRAELSPSPSEPAPPAPAATKPTDAPVEDVEREVPRTLGRSSHADDDE